MAPRPGYRSRSIDEDTIRLVDEFRREIPEIPSSAEVIAWMAMYAQEHRRDFLRFAKQRQSED